MLLFMIATLLAVIVYRTDVSSKFYLDSTLISSFGSVITFPHFSH